MDPIRGYGDNFIATAVSGWRDHSCDHSAHAGSKLLLCTQTKSQKKQLEGETREWSSTHVVPVNGLTSTSELQACGLRGVAPLSTHGPPAHRGRKGRGQPPRETGWRWGDTLFSRTDAHTRAVFRPLSPAGQAAFVHRTRGGGRGSTHSVTITVECGAPALLFVSTFELSPPRTQLFWPSAAVCPQASRPSSSKSTA